MASSDDEIPEVDVCEHLCREFASITSTDTALGHMFLQDVQWNLEVALNRYFMGNESGSSVAVRDLPALPAPAESSTASCSTGGNVVEVPVSKAAGGVSKEADQKVVRLLSWNIDGLDQNGLSIRTKAVCTIVLREKPTVAFFQEVTDDSLEILADYLSDEYWVLKGKQPSTPSGAYYTAMLLKKGAVELGREPEVIPFSGTAMGRSLLKIEVEIFGCPCVLMTSHLESTKECTRERVEQLRRCFNVLEKNIPDNVTAFFGGDLNLRDVELQQAGGIPAGVEDLWIACGSPKEYQYTWDCMKNTNLNSFEGAKFKPRARFDRIYVKHAGANLGPSWKPQTFSFVGTERILKYGRFPSDHWGIVCDLVKI